MAKKFDVSNLDRIATDPIMDQTINAIVGAPSEEHVSSVSDTKNNVSKPKSKGSKKTASENFVKEPNARVTYNYQKTEMDIDGVGVVDFKARAV